MSRIVYVPQRTPTSRLTLVSSKKPWLNFLHGGCTEQDMLIWMSQFSLESIGQAELGLLSIIWWKLCCLVNTCSLQSTSSCFHFLFRDFCSSYHLS
ncbi:hypothetical protein EI94DRAFT_1066284 [Lactarius quietus]|nr:hypothetical protein EI94DRAFT_1066284 [Lactarius quietus]